MSGHSKWSTIKRQKGATDAKRGAAFTRAANAVTIAAKEAGGNPETNFKLRLAIDAARAINMPKDNIERAIARGTGGSKEGSVLEEIIYEGFGPQGVAVLVEAVTDNRQRTVQEVRSIFDRSGGNLAGPGSVSHFFKPVGEIVVRISGQNQADELFLTVADGGAEDMENSKTEAIIYTRPADLEQIRKQITESGYEITEARLAKKATTLVNVTDEKTLSSIISLINKLEELDDVQKVYVNFDAPEGLLEEQTT